MRLIPRTGLILTGLLAAALTVTGCGSRQSQSTGSDVLGEAAREATAIIEQAQATAMVLQAQVQATQMMWEAASNEQASDPGPTLVARVPTSAEAESSGSPTPEPVKEENPVQEVIITSVSFAGDGGMIMVRFLAPPEEAEKWWQGSVTVTDEANGSEYNEIPVMPRIGPLIGRPKRDGQIGYVMLINNPPGLQSGALVTVRLGNYQFEHVPVQ